MCEQQFTLPIVAMLMQQDVERELIRTAGVEKSSSMEWKYHFAGHLGSKAHELLHAL